MDSGRWLGFCELEDSLPFQFLIRDGSDTPVNATATPSCRVYGPAGFLLAVTPTQATVSLSTGVSDGSLITFTSSAAHNLVTGQRITVAGTSGTGSGTANADWTVNSAPTTTTFTVSSAASVNVTGGTVKLAGLYQGSIAATAANGFEAGTTYDVLVQGTITGGTVKGQLHGLTVT